ncbi:hypothetical protein [Streptomyces sp. NBC_00847]|uniref:hypothetical protein n=1 Tax=unclassified Streptomyces TaxID=2593676 RepID=UPI002253CD49|nr:hypothetical protein [Streptomyces sp. NBC_00847]MCX4878153.1 hypothetical protein [Streptomyces sp. NBC_00847]
MRIRIALAATALGALVVLGGASAANADTGDEGAFGTGSQESFGTSSQVNQDWQGPAFDDQAAGLGTEGNLDLGQKDNFGGADAAFQR